jgi:DNA invertase Pin-like site-specific DNA recombinase
MCPGSYTNQFLWSAETLQQIRREGFHSAHWRGPLADVATPDGRMMATLLAGLVAFERELIQERVKSGSRR